MISEARTDPRRNVMLKATVPVLPELGRLEDLPQDYRDALAACNLVPLWPNLRAFLPPEKPVPRTRTTRWDYGSLRPLLMEAGELTPIEKAERRVLALANPGHGHEKMLATSSIYLGMQLLLPQEVAPSHRHTPNAARLIVEGEGAYTAVDGVKHYMSRGDLILTPSGIWHEHGHDGTAPVVWLDILDLPLVHYLEAAYVVEADGVSTPPRPQPQGGYLVGGVVPSAAFRRSTQAYPVMRYAWTEVRAALQSLAETAPKDEAVQVTYVNPETGDDCQHIIGFHALMLRPDERRALPVRSPASIFHVIEGAVQVDIDGAVLALGEADTCSAPGYADITLTNASANAPCFIFIADEGPLQRKLGLYEVRGRNP
jgi:gentisate 1,2-dioxygenase